MAEQHVSGERGEKVNQQCTTTTFSLLFLSMRDGWNMCCGRREVCTLEAVVQ